MSTCWIITRIALALFWVACGVAPSVFLIHLFGVNSRTATVAIWPVAAAVLVACLVDGAVRDAITTREPKSDAYAKRMKAVMLVAGVLLGIAVLVFLGLVVMAASRSISQ